MMLRQVQVQVRVHQLQDLQELLELSKHQKLQDLEDLPELQVLQELTELQELQWLQELQELLSASTRLGTASIHLMQCRFLPQTQCKGLQALAAPTKHNAICIQPLFIPFFTVFLEGSA